MNSDNVEKFISIATVSFSDKTNVAVKEIHSFVDSYPTMQIHQFELNKQEKLYIKRQLESMIQTTMGSGGTLKDKTYKPWLRAKSENINFYYWNRYKRLLYNNHFGPNVVNKIDIVTDEILDLLQDPDSGGSWSRKGLVVGHVQSGKTANYTGLIAKAFDSGYKIVIILAGLLNSLRKQTQERIEEGIIGINSAKKLSEVKKEEKLVGVGKIDIRKFPVQLTTVDADFNIKFARQTQNALDQYSKPVVFVVKKNVGIIKNLIKWLESNNFELGKYPLLLVDDEADHGSINTKKNELDPTMTNKRIRELLELFPKNIYLGYTATPFANIFINPDTDEDMMDDLFPENFIKSLDAPSNYFGGEKIYLNDDLDAVKIVDDHSDILPTTHKIEDHPDFLPDSLETAIENFIIVCAIRILRGDSKKSNSMLVNVSRFTGIQSTVKDLIHYYLSEVRDSIKGYYALDEKVANQNNVIKKIKDVFDKEYLKVEFSWSEVLKKLNSACSKIQTIEVNGSATAEKDIDYSKENYPDGRSVIAVGGISLSRGITLEGLSISYFLRNSMAYDTLMQMGRWFGYRPGYEDLCKVYMTDESRGYYAHITLATEELRREFKKMISMDMTPRDFGLKVRNHPESLIVTARNKMRSAKTHIRELDLTGQEIQTNRLFSKSRIINANMNVALNLYNSLKNNEKVEKLPNKKHKLWRLVSLEYVQKFLEGFENHPGSMQTDSDTIIKYVNEIAKNVRLDQWNIIFISPKGNAEKHLISKMDGFEDLNPSIRRNVSFQSHNGILFYHRSLTSGGTRDLDKMKADERKIPLLAIYLVDCRQKQNPQKTLFKNGIIGYGMYFPGSKIMGNKKILATYQVNTTWMNNQYGLQFEDEEDIGEDIN
jgi:hypothetical protein